MSQPVQAVVALSHRSHEAAERICLVVARVSAILVDLAHTDLDGSVVFRLDDATGRAALAGYVAENKESLAI